MDVEDNSVSSEMFMVIMKHSLVHNQKSLIVVRNDIVLHVAHLGTSWI